MEYIESPEIWTRTPDQPSVFLAGGFTGCSNWQIELAKMLRNTNYVVLNPRRKTIVDSPESAEIQINWEFEYLRKADLISFWFCNNAIQPIALFELGAWSGNKDPAVVIGVEPGYPRALDIRIQMGLLGRNRIVSTLEDLAKEIILIESSLRTRLANKAIR